MRTASIGPGTTSTLYSFRDHPHTEVVVEIGSETSENIPLETFSPASRMRRARTPRPERKGITFGALTSTTDPAATQVQPGQPTSVAPDAPTLTVSEIVTAREPSFDTVVIAPSEPAVQTGTQAAEQTE